MREYTEPARFVSRNPEIVADSYSISMVQNPLVLSESIWHQLGLCIASPKCSLINTASQWCRDYGFSRKWMALAELMRWNFESKTISGSISQINLSSWYFSLGPRTVAAGNEGTDSDP